MSGGRRVAITGVVEPLGRPSSRAGSSATPESTTSPAIDTLPPPVELAAHRLHRGRHPQRRALALAAGDRRRHGRPLRDPLVPGARPPGRALHEINVIGTLQLLAACERTEALRTVIVRGSAAIYGCEARGAVVLTPRTWPRAQPLRTRFQRDISELEEYFDNFARRHPRADLLHAALPARDRPGARQPAGPLPEPAGGAGAARLRPAAAAAPRRRRDRGARGRGREPGPRRRSTSPRRARSR